MWGLPLRLWIDAELIGIPLGVIATILLVIYGNA